MKQLAAPSPPPPPPPTLLRWNGTLKYGGVHEKFNFLKIQDLRPLNTCQKHFQTILPSFPLDDTQWYNFFYIETAIATAVYNCTIRLV